MDPLSPPLPLIPQDRTERRNTSRVYNKKHIHPSPLIVASLLEGGGSAEEIFVNKRTRRFGKWRDALEECVKLIFFRFRCCIHVFFWRKVPIRDYFIYIAPEDYLSQRLFKLMLWEMCQNKASCLPCYSTSCVKKKFAHKPRKSHIC